MTKLTMYIGGIFFGFGLAYAGATSPEIVLSFLNLDDLGLLFVILIGLLFTLVVFQGVPKLIKKPPFGERFDVHDGLAVTSRTFTGAVIFGVGWGISGICPATSISAVGTGNWPLWFAIAGMFIGALIYGTIRSRQVDKH